MKISLSGRKILGLDAWQVKTFIGPVIMAGLLLVSLFQVIVPKTGEIRRDWGLINKLRSQSKQLDIKRSYLLSLDQEEVKKNYDFLNMALLPLKDSYFLVNAVRDVAAKYEYRVESFITSPGAVGTSMVAGENKKDMGLVPVSIEAMLQGPVEKYFELIEGMEKALPIMAFDGLEIKSSLGGSELKASIFSYFSPAKNDFKADSFTLAELTLNQEEMDFIKTLEDYQRINDFNFGEEGLLKTGEFVDYNRSDPFAP